jgi:hypothetical protein
MVNKSERLCLFFDTSFEGMFLAIARLSVEMYSRPSCTGSAVKSRSEITRSEVILVARRSDLEQGWKAGREWTFEGKVAQLQSDSKFISVQPVLGQVDLYAGNLTPSSTLSQPYGASELSPDKES